VLSSHYFLFARNKFWQQHSLMWNIRIKGLISIGVLKSFSPSYDFNLIVGAVVIVCQLHVQSVPIHGEVYSIQHYVIKSVTCIYWWFSPGTPVSSTNKTDRHNITEILLKVALNTINLNQSI
jgi:hypothetical protein